MFSALAPFSGYLVVVQVLGEADCPPSYSEKNIEIASFAMEKGSRNGKYVLHRDRAALGIN